MSEMIERVAKAMWDIRPTGDEDSERGIPTWDGLGKDWQDVYRLMARAAVEAMREPDDEMVDAGVTAETGRTLGSRVTNCWQAMIDASLAPAVSKGDTQA